MIFKNRTIQKFISCLVILTMLTPALFVSFKSKKADAFLGFGDIVYDPIHTAVTTKIVAQEIYRQFLMIAARALLNKITQSTVNWINSGFHGNPLYLENPKSFFKDIAKYEVRTLIDLFGYNSLKYPFGKYFALNTIDAYKRRLEDNMQYSLSKVIYDPLLLDRYRNDFYMGGWNGFLINTQYPQNNYIGFQLLATEELARRLQDTNFNNAQKVKTVLDQGMGFLSPQVCLTNPLYNNSKNQFLQPSFKSTVPYNPPPVTGAFDENGNWIQDPASVQAKEAYDYAYEIDFNVERAQWDQKSTCPGGLVSTTPGSVVANQIIGAMGSKFRQGELAAALGNSLAAIFDALLNKFMSSGLNTLSDRTNQPYSSITIDDFEYAGNTINTINTGDPGGYTGPQPPSSGGSGGGTGTISDQTSVVQAARDKLIAQGMKWNQTSPTYECDRFEITKLAVQNIGMGASLLPKTTGTNCGGYSVDVIIFPNGEMYDIVGGGSDGAGAQWLYVSGGSGGGGGGFGNDVFSPPPVAGNFSNVVWEDTDVSGWAETASLSVSISGSGDIINLNYDKTNSWPAGFPLDPVTALNANAWILVYRNSNWHASTWDWMRPGQTSKDTSNLFQPDAAGTLRGTLSNFSPQSGDTYGFMVSCLARSGTRNCTERSSVFMATWP